MNLKTAQNKLVLSAAALIVLAVAVLAFVVAGQGGAGNSAGSPTPAVQSAAQVVARAAAPTDTAAPPTALPTQVPTNTTAPPPPATGMAVPPANTAVPAEPGSPTPAPVAAAPDPANPTVNLTPVANTQVPVLPTLTSNPGKPAARKAQPGVVMLPNGVRYGDHYPNLPSRIAHISSPNIKLNTKVYEVYATKKNEWEVAEYAAGHHYNSKNPGEGGNIVLSGHNNWRGEVFRYLEFLKPGNEIDITTLDGKKWVYKVESVQKLQEAGASLAQRIGNGKVMDQTPYEQLTLITCWPYTTYTHRLIVIAKPVK